MGDLEYFRIPLSRTKKRCGGTTKNTVLANSNECNVPCLKKIVFETVKTTKALILRSDVNSVVSHLPCASLSEAIFASSA